MRIFPKKGERLVLFDALATLFYVVMALLVKRPVEWVFFGFFASRWIGWYEIRRWKRLSDDSLAVAKACNASARQMLRLDPAEPWRN